jgi:hypothetical protein
MGRDGQMNLDQPEELTEQVGSKKNLDQQMQLTEEEHQDDILMIGGIEIIPTICPGGGRKFCCTCSNSRTVTVGDDCQKRRGNWSRYLRLPKQMKRRMSVLRNNSMISASKLKEL